MGSVFQPPQKIADLVEGTKASNNFYKWTIDLLKRLGLNGSTNNAIFATTDVAGFSGTIVTAKLTVAGANGSMTFVNGVLTAQTPAT